MTPKHRTESIRQSGHPRTRHLDPGLNLLFLAAFPLLLWAFRGSFSGTATAIALIWVLSVALRLISTGQKLHDAYDAAPVAFRPRMPRKILGSALIGVMVLILAGHSFQSLLPPLVCGALGMLLSLVAFGPDPLRDKGTDDAATLQRMRTGAALEAAEMRLSGIADTVAALGDAELVRRTEAVRGIVMRQLRRAAGRPAVFARVNRGSDKLIAILSAEAARLAAAQGHQNPAFARRRFLAKLDLIRDNINARLGGSGDGVAEDAFDMEADRLLHRMPRESAA